MATRTVLNYIGVKNLDHTKYETEKYETYCEPFGGSFNSGLKLLQQGFKGQTVYNDLDIAVYNFWNCVIEDVNRLWEKCERLDTNIINYITVDEQLRTLNMYRASEDKFRRAAAEYVYRKYLTLTGFRVRRMAIPFEHEELILASELLKNTKLYNMYYFDIMGMFNDESTFMLIDPPYLCKKIDSYYRCESSNFDHKLLKKKVDQLKGGFVLTYNDCDEIRKLYKEYKIEEVKQIKCGRQYCELYITRG